MSTKTKDLAPGTTHPDQAVDQIKSGRTPAVELHVTVRSRYRKLVESKVLGGLPRSLAEDTARRQIEHDHGVDVARAALAQALEDRDETIATAGVASNARQVPQNDNPPAKTPVEVKFDGTKKDE